MATAFAPSDDATPALRGRGRPTGYNTEIARLICEAVKASQTGLRRTLEDDPALPELRTVQRWLEIYPDFAHDYSRAKADHLKAMSEDIIDISDDESIDPADKRIRIETRRWLLSKLIPKTYGDKLDLTSGGEAIATPSHQIDARVQSIIMQAQARKANGVELDLPAEALRLLE